MSKIPFDGMDLTGSTGRTGKKIYPLTLKDKEREHHSYRCSLSGWLISITILHNPIDNTHTISSTIGRHNEFTLNLASIGIETNYKNIIGRLWLQYGQMGSIVQDLDGYCRSGKKYQLSANLKYIREAAAGYHFNKWYGINVEMGIFMSYIGLESYVTQENWSYQRSMVCDFTPFYFSGARVQVFPSKNLKQNYGCLMAGKPIIAGAKVSALAIQIISDQMKICNWLLIFIMGKDTRNSNRIRFHHDNSIVKQVLQQTRLERYFAGCI